jgi:hypothetical protein
MTPPNNFVSPPGEQVRSKFIQPSERSDFYIKHSVKGLIKDEETKENWELQITKLQRS